MKIFSQILILASIGFPSICAAATYNCTGVNAKNEKMLQHALKAYHPKIDLKTNTIDVTGEKSVADLNTAIKKVAKLKGVNFTPQATETTTEPATSE